MDDLIRAVDFEFTVIDRSAGAADGLTLEGYAAVFNSPARINNWEGNFDEVILPGAFRSSIERSTPKLMFEHGQHPLIGSMPLGTIDQISEDGRGLHIKARLSDNWLIQPVRDAIRDGAVSGMSFRMLSASIVDKWERRSGNVDLRSISQLDVPELGPVVFPAYKPTTVSVRSLIDQLEPDFAGQPDAQSAGGGVSDSSDDGPPATPTPQDLGASRHRLLRAKGIL